MVYHSGARNLSDEINKVFDDAVETLRWTRLHYHEPRASEGLKELETKLGYLAQAIAWEEDGDRSRADQALGLAQGRSIREQDSIRRMWEEMWWSH
jgi:hypothetical protein